ncbi:MAG: pre-toxin TG domain-containing protein, partial [bacterium]|nr:pre-toxin TG domain-containing protein [bacterium]
AKEWFVTDNWADYSITLPLSNGKHAIDVVYSNDQDTETIINTWTEKVGKWWKGTSRTIVHTDTVHNVIADRTLWVDSICVGERLMQAEDVSKVSYDRGESNKFGSYFDGKDLSTGREKLEWAGALRVTADVNNNIPVLNNELKDIPDVKRLVVDDKGNVVIENNAPILESVNLDRILHANGTVLKADNRLYLVSSGLGREIRDDKKTLEALGIDRAKIVNVSSDKLPVISQEPALEIKYSNGTVLKDGDKYYFMQAGARMLIPDKTTFDAMGLSQNNTASITKDEMDKIPEAAPLPKIKYANNSLVKGSGETVYMVMCGRKMAVPEGTATYDGYGLDRNNVQTITDEELASIPTDDGLERIEHHDTQTYKNKTLQRLLSAVVKFIPVVGQVYTAVSALAGRDLITNDKMSGADIGLGLLGGFGSWANAASSTSKVANIARLGKEVKAVDGLIKAGKVAGDMARFATDFRNISMIGFGADPFTNQKISGANRLLSGLSFAGSNTFDGFNGNKLGKLTTQQVTGLS